GAFSIEPFLYTDSGLVTWSAARTEQSLEDGYLPIPSVTWRHNRLGLRVTAFATGEAGRSTLFARYRVENHGDDGEPVQLFLAIRPFQVNPPWQSLNMSGGVTHIQEMRFDGRTVWVNRDKAVVSITSPDHFGAGTFEEGSVTQFLVRGKVPPQTDVSDPFGFASGALQYNFYLEPRAHAEVDLAVPWHDARVAAAGLGSDGNAAWVAERHEEARRHWQNVLDRVEIALPPSAEKIVRTLKTTLAYILINRDGPALRPGSRNYARSWIRDGALTSVALLQLGTVEEVRHFLEWYARYQTADGKVPCCVDRRGADPVVENDSPGAFIFGIAEYYRFTHDVGFLADMWPRVVRAVDYLSSLRKRRMTEEFRAPDKQALYGLLPESISHEGYAAHPVHSYWDDFFALRGLKDGAADSDAYTPYEIRNVGTFLRLGQRERALALLDWFLADRRPVGWNEWAEIAWRDPTAPRFIGDMPHTWVGAGYIRSVRSLFAYERESDGTLVLAAGVPAAWVREEPGVVVKRLPTHYGVLNYTLRAEGPDAVRFRLSGDLAVPPGKIVVSSPLGRPLRSVKVNGKPVDTFTADGAVITECPADVVLGYEPGST